MEYVPRDYDVHLLKYGSGGLYERTDPETTKEIIDRDVRRYEEMNEAQPVHTYYIKPEPVRRNTNSRTGRGEEGRIWAEAVKSRDGYQCQKPDCSTRAGIMHAHHIHNYADWPELRTDESNGITLCEPCHKEFHLFYGKSRTTYENLEEFFGSYLLNAENVTY
ncbi:HNH endonuclease signature motif containing protein [Alteribacter populi]|uniref:HNH endonuclease signature motif containing protein n=1 Tax=Alteribacter populi TaxID=2011011 RepID=UPI0012FFB04D|nr:HNH endonuclease signature motif containing protein [Alteribacter populi]